MNDAAMRAGAGGPHATATEPVESMRPVKMMTTALAAAIAALLSIYTLLSVSVQYRFDSWCVRLAFFGARKLDFLVKH